MRWPWRRQRDGNDSNGDAASAARADAQGQLRRAHARTPRVDETARRAAELARRADWFARDIERAMRPRGTT